MKNWLSNLRYRLQRFMQGRYGVPDELSRFLLFAEWVLIILACLFRPLRFLMIAALALMGYSLFRTFSRNIPKRQTERAKYLRFRSAIRSQFRLWKNQWRDRKTHRYYRCPHCKAVARIPKPTRHGTITITCPKCAMRFDRKV